MQDLIEELKLILDQLEFEASQSPDKEAEITKLLTEIEELHETCYYYRNRCRELEHRLFQLETQNHNSFPGLDWVGSIAR